MILLTSFTVISLTVFFFLRNSINKKLQAEYERYLMTGNKKMAAKTGKLYYYTLHPRKKKAKGIVSVNKKIVEDFKAFNIMRLI